MRRFFGWILFVLGLVILGWWARGHQAVNMQNQVTASSEAIAEDYGSTLSEGMITKTTSGRDITLSGYISESEHQATIDAFSDTEGRRVVRDDIEIMPMQEPYIFNVIKSEEGSVTITGFTNSPDARDAILEHNTDANITLASGAPDGWNDAVSKGMSALDHLSSGKLNVENQSISLTGTAETAAKRDTALAGIATLSGFANTADVKAPIVGPEFMVNFDITSGLNFTGTSTTDTDAAALAEALGVPMVSNNIDLTNEGTINENLGDRFTHLGGHIANFDKAEISVTADTLNFKGWAAPNIDAAQLQEELASGLGADDQISIEVSDATDGDVRNNVLAGYDEIYSGNLWLPKINFTVDLTNCGAETNKVLANNKILFVTGSARIDASSRRVINSLAGIIKQCLAAGNMALEVGGHTDSDGDDDANLALSDERANAVVAAMKARGIDIANITARGYGEVEPIATNDTNEGKAANRRTTLIWINK